MGVTPDTCPNCGVSVPEYARCCPECGADEETGWSESAHAERLGIPAEEFDYERFVREDLEPRAQSPAVPGIWWITSLLLLILFGYLLFWR